MRRGFADGGAPFGVLSAAEQAEVPPTFLDRGVAGAIKGFATLPQRAIEASAGDVQRIGDPTRQGIPESVKTGVETVGTMMGGAPAVSGVSRAGEVALGVVPVDAARSFGIKSRLPTDEGFAAAVRNTPGASIDDGMLRMNVARGQKPEQELSDSVRGGVFYLPQGDKNAKFYSGKNHNYAYGGDQKIAGETGFMAPLYVKGATGGKAPEAAMDTLLGKGAYQNMRTDALRSTGASYLPRADRVELIEQFLTKYAPEMSGYGQHILSSSSKGNQLPYALQEAAVASAARAAGHDGVIGYSMSRKTKEPFISEVYDVREKIYPSPHGDFETWDIGQFGPHKAEGGSVSDPAMKVARDVAAEAGDDVHIGAIRSAVAGRTDHHAMEVPSGCFVLPADVVSGLGEGNTESGFAILEHMFPESHPLMSAKETSATTDRKAEGGMVSDSGAPVPIMAAGGEFVISPNSIKKRWGDLETGHQFLDHFIITQRKNLIKTLKGLPGPAQD